MKYGNQGSQVAGDRSTRRDLRVHIGGAVLICITESSCVYETKRLRVVQERVEDGPCVEDGHLIKVMMLCLEGFGARDELSVVVVQ
jgi:hypothetical protein